MALKKVKELPSGIQGEYWKIVESKIDRISRMLTVRIALFKDKAASDSGKKHLGLVHLFSGQIAKEEMGGDLTGMGYGIIKAQCQINNLQNIVAKNDLKNSEDI